ncbi:MAG: SMC family ATPase [Deltaproteobacteria bacterium]|nr:SMC family ATPase [Deltaproteobacteria bacterium]
MRPRRLRMEAFGAYPGRQDLDFDILGDRRFFLIHGATGSGKTTILDAICFALYGTLSGSARQAANARSEMADDDAETSVRLDFSLGSEHYRVERKPEQVRAKKRGEGTTKVAPKATLWRRTNTTDDADEGKVMATGPRNVDQMIVDILGFDADQFRQVVVLPQGEFLGFIKGGSKDREQILRALFPTQRFAEIENALRDRSRDVQERIEDVRKRRAFIWEQAEVDSDAALHEALDGARTARKDAEAHVLEMQQVHEAARAALTHGKSLAEAFAAARDAAAALAALTAKAEEMTALEQALEKARKAAELRDLDQAVEATAKDLSQGQTALKAAAQAWESAEERLAGAREMVEQTSEHDARVEAMREEERRVGDWLERLESLTKARADHATATKALVDARDDETKAKQARDATTQKLRELTERKEAIAVEGTQAKELRRAADEASERVQWRTKLLATSKQLVSAELDERRSREAIEKLREDETAARDALRSLEQVYMKQQAAVLAAGLSDGEPCPVCGSIHHPIPATPSDDDVAAEAVDDARARLDDLGRTLATRNDALTELTSATTRLRADRDNLVERLKDAAEAPLEELTARANDALAQAEKAGRAAETLADLERQIEAARQEQTQSDEVFSAQTQAVNDAATKAGKTEAIVAEREASVPTDQRDKDGLTQRRAELVAQMDVLRNARAKALMNERDANDKRTAAVAAHQAATHAQNQAQERYDAAVEAFEQRLGQKGFADKEAYRAAARSEAEIDAMAGELTAYREKIHAAKEHAVRAKAKVEDKSEPDPDALTATENDAGQKLETAREDASRRRRRVEQLEKWMTDLAAVTKDENALEARFATVGHVARVVAGDNPQRLSFSRFVLGAYLDDVLIAASQRMLVMSQHRYRIQRQMTAGDLRRASGLDLEVVDNWTGGSRDISTLSGGESFMAALALALGLADVVQAYSGGVHLETIFVDEGFGSLDPEALDAAMRVLQDLQKGGRLVGIISHVDELKERIDVRLEVTGGERGSRARFVV